MELMVSKKAVMFSLIAVSLLSLLLFTYSSSYSYHLSERFSVVETRVNTMEGFMQDLDKNLQQGVYVAGFRSLIGMTSFVTENSSFISDVNTTFEELFTNGSVNGSSSFIMVNNTFSNWTLKMQGKAQDIGITVAFNLNSIGVYHDTPWEVIIAANVSVTLTDTKGVAQWQRTLLVTPGVEIEGFEDPLYSYYTGGGVSELVNQTMYDGNFAPGNDTTNLERHMNLTYYSASTAAPSYLMRFSNDLNASANGIESLVDKSEVGLYHICPAGTSSVDHIYWACDDSISVWQVTGMPSAFRLDNETVGSQGRLEKYQVNGLTT